MPPSSPLCALLSHGIDEPPLQSLQYGVDLRGGELDAMGMPLFRPLTTYSWEQSDGLVKIYVPLRGVQTELLRCSLDCCLPLFVLSDH